MDTPLSQTNISLRLAEIQKRCEELMKQKELSLRLEDQEQKPLSVSDPYNPYNRTK